MKTARFALVFLNVFFSYTVAMAGIHHTLEITLTPAVKSLTATDTVTLKPASSYRFLLNKNLQVRLSDSSKDDGLRQIHTATATELAHEYELRTGALDSQATLEFTGVIFTPVTDNDSSGLIAPEGAALFGSTYWAPDFHEKTTYQISKINLPADWKLASPLAQLKIPQPEIYLIAGPFTEFVADSAGIPLKVYLRSSEANLAQTFLSLLPGYLDHYQKTLGAFPYDSFAVIENFWETGFGMPGFTLLGPGVIRLPYILNSSLPHELLHNWWGNSVFVDYDRGNWCEGLTTYLADHWQQEILQAGREYRRQSLMNFQDYTKAANDFPLRNFKQRFNFSSQAVGYGKGMMLFHMLRVRLGEAVFSQALRDLYQNYQGQSISYEEIETSFTTTSRQDLKLFFKQWLDRTGAPTLRLQRPQRAQLADSKHQVNFELEQLSPQNYELTVPVRFTFTDGSSQEETLTLNSTLARYQFSFAKTPKSLEVDPRVDIFRDLDASERPLSLSNVFGSKKIWLTGTDSSVLPLFQQSWQASLESQIALTDDKILQDLPPEGAVVLIGDSTRYEELMTRELAGQDFKVSPEEITILGANYARKDIKTVLVARSQTRPGVLFVWIRGPQVESLAPRLLHYGKFGVLAFADKTVPLKATWPILKSPLRVDW